MHLTERGVWSWHMCVGYFREVRVCPTEQPNALTCTFIKWLEKSRHLSSGIQKCGTGVWQTGFASLSGVEIRTQIRPACVDRLRWRVRLAQLVLSSRTLHQDMQLSAGSWETPNYRVKTCGCSSGQSKCHCNPRFQGNWIFDSLYTEVDFLLNCWQF